MFLLLFGCAAEAREFTCGGPGSSLPVRASGGERGSETPAHWDDVFL